MNIYVYIYIYASKINPAVEVIGKDSHIYIYIYRYI
jgi:hypothetical protein